MLVFLMVSVAPLPAALPDVPWLPDPSAGELEVIGAAELVPYAEPGEVEELPHAVSTKTSVPSPVTAHPRLRITSLHSRWSSAPTSTARRKQHPGSGNRYGTGRRHL